MMVVMIVNGISGWEDIRTLRDLGSRYGSEFHPPTETFPQPYSRLANSDDDATAAEETVRYWRWRQTLVASIGMKPREKEMKRVKNRQNVEAFDRILSPLQETHVIFGNDNIELPFKETVRIDAKKGSGAIKIAFPPKKKLSVSELSGGEEGLVFPLQVAFFSPYASVLSWKS